MAVFIYNIGLYDNILVGNIFVGLRVEIGKGGSY